MRLSAKGRGSRAGAPARNERTIATEGQPIILQLLPQTAVTFPPRRVEHADAIAADFAGKPRRTDRIEHREENEELIAWDQVGGPCDRFMHSSPLRLAR